MSSNKKLNNQVYTLNGSYIPYIPYIPSCISSLYNLAKLKYFTNLDFPQIRGFPFLNATFWAEVVWDRYNLTSYNGLFTRKQPRGPPFFHGSFKLKSAVKRVSFHRSRRLEICMEIFTKID